MAQKTRRVTDAQLLRALSQISEHVSVAQEQEFRAFVVLKQTWHRFQ